MIHPAGLGGSPVEGQRSRATTKASWTASSARSMSPKKRTRLATARPDSERKTRSISDGSSSGSTWVRSLALEGPDLDLTGARGAGFLGHGQRGIEVGELDDP